MVRERNVSRYRESEPPQEGESRRIPRQGPIYSEEEVLELLAQPGAAVQAWTQDCLKNMQDLGLDSDDLPALVRQAVQTGRYKGSEWCQNRADGPWAACDAYTVVRHEWNDVVARDVETSYYLKFGISATGTVVLMVSCHL